MYYGISGLGATGTTLGQDIVAKATASVDAYVLPIGHVALEFQTDSEIEAQGMAQRVWNMPLKPTLGGLKKLWESGKGLVDEKNLALFTTGNSSLIEQLGEQIASLFGGGKFQVLYRDVLRLVTWTSDISAAAQRSERTGDLAAAACYYYALALTMRSVKRVIGGSLIPDAPAKIADQFRQKLIDAAVAKAKGVVLGVQAAGVAIKQAQAVAAAKAAATKAAADAAAQVATVKTAADAKTKQLLEEAAAAQKRAVALAQQQLQEAQSDAAAEKKKQDTTMLVVAGVGALALVGVIVLMKKRS